MCHAIFFLILVTKRQEETLHVVSNTKTFVSVLTVGRFWAGSQVCDGKLRGIGNTWFEIIMERLRRVGNALATEWRNLLQ